MSELSSNLTASETPAPQLATAFIPASMTDSGPLVDSNGPNQKQSFEPFPISPTAQIDTLMETDEQELLVTPAPVDTFENENSLSIMEARSLLETKKDTPATQCLSLGDAVEARWQGGDEWFPGRIDAVNPDGTFNIAYDDGDVENRVDTNIIRKAGSDSAGYVPPPPPPPLVNRESGRMEHSRNHPRLLESNATSHSWPFGALAELVDNAQDEDVGATDLKIDVRRNVLVHGRNYDQLVFEDNGTGMTRNQLLRMLSFGFSEKEGKAGNVGRFGIGFKSGSIKLSEQCSYHNEAYELV